ncbi:MAG: ureidoglycolate lyase [Anaerolineae bacterium]|nr:ureidoglycolate lyase [Anaerolineae bacterium]
MRTVEVSELSVEAFLPFGFYADMLNPQHEKIGAPPIEFFRDMVQQDLGGAPVVSFSNCRVEPRALVIDTLEYHTATGEGILPLDGDVLLQVGPATPPEENVPLDRIKVFRIPKGTMVVLRPGVWHHAPFAVGDTPVNVLIVLPERTYANDCDVVELVEEDRIRIEL